MKRLMVQRFKPLKLTSTNNIKAYLVSRALVELMERKINEITISELSEMSGISCERVIQGIITLRNRNDFSFVGVNCMNKFNKFNFGVGEAEEESTKIDLYMSDPCNRESIAKAYLRHLRKRGC